ncbi:MAG: hypothetical protein CM1200mP30_03980 [Pseudomonadota bacterium]|nr:MAG: hypothetical protein CM1200mP30_03980 [Pseudomonadota bacterium]
MGIDDGQYPISGRVGWSFAENMMAGTIVVEKTQVQPLEQQFAVEI